MNPSEKKTFFWVAVALAVAFCVVSIFYQFFTYVAPEYGWLKRPNGETAIVLGGSRYFKSPNDKMTFYARYNHLEKNYACERSDSACVKAKASVIYSFDPEHMSLSPEGYAELISVILSDAIQDAAFWSKDEGEFVLHFRNRLEKHTKHTGLTIFSTLVSGYEVVESSASKRISDMNTETRRRRASRQAQVEMAK